MRKKLFPILFSFVSIILCIITASSVYAPKVKAVFNECGDGVVQSINGGRISEDCDPGGPEIESNNPIIWPKFYDGKCNPPNMASEVRCKCITGYLPDHSGNCLKPCLVQSDCGNGEKCESERCLNCTFSFDFDGDGRITNDDFEPFTDSLKEDIMSPQSYLRAIRLIPLSGEIDCCSPDNKCNFEIRFIKGKTKAEKIVEIFARKFQPYFTRSKIKMFFEEEYGERVHLWDVWKINTFIVEW